MQVLPVFFKLFECQDKALRQLLFRHIIAGEAQSSGACGARQQPIIAFYSAMPCERQTLFRSLQMRR